MYTHACTHIYAYACIAMHNIYTCICVCTYIYTCIMCMHIMCVLYVYLIYTYIMYTYFIWNIQNIYSFSFKDLLISFKCDYMSN